jgi:hypothetical protein
MTPKRLPHIAQVSLIDMRQRAIHRRLTGELDATIKLANANVDEMDMPRE